MTKSIRQLEEKRPVAEIQASEELDKRRKTPEQKGATSTRVLEEENLMLKGHVRKLSEQLQSLTTTLQERRATNSAEKGEYSDEYNEF